MPQQLNDKYLHDMTAPTVRPRHYQKQLRRVLVAYAAQKTAKPSTMQGVLQFMSKPKQIMAGVGAVAVLAVAALSLTVTQQPQSVSAREVAQTASQNLAQMSEAQVAEMSPQELKYAKYHPLFVTWLQQAEQAPDLQLLTYEGLVEKYPHLKEAAPTTHDPLLVIDDPRDGATPDPRSLRYLEFTGNDNGHYKVAIGVNDHNVPEAALHYIIEVGVPIMHDQPIRQ